MAERIHIVNTGDDMGWFAPSPFRLRSRPRSRPRRSQASTAPDRQRLVAFDLRLGVARSLLATRLGDACGQLGQLAADDPQTCDRLGVIARRRRIRRGGRRRRRGGRRC